MSFDDKPTEDLIRLAKAGLGFKLNPDRKSADDVRRIIDAAFEGGATISFIAAHGVDSVISNSPSATD